MQNVHQPHGRHACAWAPLLRRLCSSMSYHTQDLGMISNPDRKDCTLETHGVTSVLTLTPALLARLEKHMNTAEHSWVARLKEYTLDSRGKRTCPCLSLHYRDTIPQSAACTGSGDPIPQLLSLRLRCTVTKTGWCRKAEQARDSLDQRTRAIKPKEGDARALQAIRAMLPAHSSHSPHSRDPLSWCYHTKSESFLMVRTQTSVCSTPARAPR